MPCWCRFGHTETWTFKETAWCKNWNEVAMSRGADVGGLDTTACKPSYHVNSLLYTSKNYSGVILGFLITFCVTISFFSVCYIICKINKSQSFFYISFLFKFFKWYITISFSLYYVYQTTNSCPVWGHLFQFWTLSNNCDNPLAKFWTLVQT